MSAQLSPAPSDSPEPPPAAQATSRWAARLRELSADRPPDASDSPEPLSIRPHRSLWEHAKRGVAVPAAAASAAFVLTIVVSIAMVWAQPHAVGAATANVTGEQSADSALAGAPQTAHSNEAPTGAKANAEVGWAGSGSDSGTAASTRLFVHVVGEVAAPGVYELEAGSRVLAAIEAAGGATESAVLSALNLARPLGDGEQVLVPNAEAAASLTAASAAGAAGTGSENPSAQMVNGGLVNLNTADLSALETLPRVGPALAQRILDWREANGAFTSPDQLLNVSGIGAKTFEQLQKLVTV